MEIVNLMASTVVFHVTDLKTLDHLTRSHLEFQFSPFPYGPLHVVSPSLKTMAITLRLPLSFFEAISIHATTSSPSGNSQIPGDYMVTGPTTDVCGREQSKVWVRVWPALAVQLKRLQSLRLWLDHDDHSSWSFVDERTALSYFATSISPDKIPSLRDVSINLPNLHPRHEKPERHFMKNSPQPPAHVTVKRRLRQRYYCEEITPGHISIGYKEDFPILLDLNVPDFEHFGFGNMTREELEDLERRLWERGEDLDNLFLL